MVRDFKRLEVWKGARELGRLVYLITKSFPRYEIYGLTSQLRRAAVNISSNIAEGCGKRDFELDVGSGKLDVRGFTNLKKRDFINIREVYLV